MASFLRVGWFCFGHMAVGYMFCFYDYFGNNLIVLVPQLTQAHSFPEYDGVQLDKHSNVTKI